MKHACADEPWNLSQRPDGGRLVTKIRSLAAPRYPGGLRRSFVTSECIRGTLGTQD